jgi:hypothetical protein
MQKEFIFTNKNIAFMGTLKKLIKVPINAKRIIFTNKNIAFMGTLKKLIKVPINAE